MIAPLNGLSPRLWAGVYSACGLLLATSADARIQVWDTSTGHQTRELTGHPAHAPFLSISPDGSLVAVGDNSGTAIVWRTDTGERVATMRVPNGRETPVQFSPDGSLLAVANNHEVVLWRVGTWSRQAILSINQDVNSLAFSPDSRTLAAGGNVRGMILWDVPSGRRLAVLGEVIGPHMLPTFSPDGRTLATLGADKTVRLWHVPTLRELFVLYRHSDNGVRWVQFESPRRLLVGTHTHTETTEYAFPPRSDAPRAQDPPLAKDHGPEPPEPKPAP